MRAVFLGTGEISVLTARTLIKQGHEVVMIEQLRDRIDELSDELDCSFLHGDGGKPAVLREADPNATNVLFCLTNNDQANILSSLVGRSLGFRRVVTSIQNLDLQGLCKELGLEHTIIPSQTISRSLVDMLHGDDTIELTTVLKGEARIFTFSVTEHDAGTLEHLDLPELTRVVCFYRDGDQLHFPDSETTFETGDEVVLLTHSRNLSTLEQRWNPANNRPDSHRQGDRTERTDHSSGKEASS